MALVLASATSVLAVDAGDATGFRAGSLQDDSDSERPTLKIEPADENVTERNATTFLVYLVNPPWNTRPKYVVLRVWSPGYDELGLRINGESPDDTFDQGTGWEFHHDLEPGRHAIYTATVGPNSRPGNYSISATGVYVEGGKLTTDTVQANVSIESVPPPPPPPLCERIVGAIDATAYGLIEWIKEHPEQALSILLTVIGVFVGLSQLLITLFGRDRYLAAVRWPARRIRGDGNQRPEESERDTSK